MAPTAASRAVSMGSAAAVAGGVRSAGGSTAGGDCGGCSAVMRRLASLPGLLGRLLERDQVPLDQGTTGGSPAAELPAVSVSAAAGGPAAPSAAAAASACCSHCSCSSRPSRRSSLPSETKRCPWPPPSGASAAAASASAGAAWAPAASLLLAATRVFRPRYSVLSSTGRPSRPAAAPPPLASSGPTSDCSCAAAGRPLAGAGGLPWPLISSGWLRRLAPLPPAAAACLPVISLDISGWLVPSSAKVSSASTSVLSTAGSERGGGWLSGMKLGWS
jgi:hypothetical protein